MTDTIQTTVSRRSERDELIALLAKHRGLFLVTAQGLTDEQARATPTVSALSVGGLVKHVTATQAQWLDFIESGAPEQSFDWANMNADAYEALANGFQMLADETLTGLIAAYDEVAARTEEVVRTVDLDDAHALPEAPWFDKDAWSNRRVLIHIIAETAQHAGHADLIRETIDGQKTMG